MKASRVISVHLLSVFLPIHQADVSCISSLGQPMSTSGISAFFMLDNFPACILVLVKSQMARRGPLSDLVGYKKEKDVNFGWGPYQGCGGAVEIKYTYTIINNTETMIRLPCFLFQVQSMLSKSSFVEQRKGSPTVGGQGVRSTHGQFSACGEVPGFSLSFLFASYLDSQCC